MFGLYHPQQTLLENLDPFQGGKKVKFMGKGERKG